MRKKKGIFIVFEGIDGSGKSTQTKLLASRLKKEGFKVAFIDFPQYGKKSAGLVEEYLSGKYGSAEEVGAYRASIFYACDRYDASFRLRAWLKAGKVVISDRYIASNIGHQGSKIKTRVKRKTYLRWLYDLEYGIFGIPRPDAIFVLKVPPEIAQRLVLKITDKVKIAKKSFLGKRKQDIHEKDLEHLQKTERAYLEAAKEFPKDFKVIECFKAGKLFSPEAIHQEIWNTIQL